MKTGTEWAQAVCNEGARVQADHQRYIDTLKAERDKLRALLSHVMDTPKESRGWTALYTEIRAALAETKG